VKKIYNDWFWDFFFLHLGIILAFKAWGHKENLCVKNIIKGMSQEDPLP
jgi:hypothetical protein